MPKHPNSTQRDLRKSSTKTSTSKKPRRTLDRKASGRPRVGFGQAPDDSGGFVPLLLQRIGWSELEGLNLRKNGAGRPAHELSRGQLLAALLFHYTVSWAGSFAGHLFWLLGMAMAESTLSERRQALPFAVFVELLRRVLRPIPEPAAEARYRRWTLAGIDGVSFSLADTKQVNQQCRKGGNQRGRAAFAKLDRKSTRLNSSHT